MKHAVTFDLQTKLYRIDGQEISHDGTCLTWRGAALSTFQKCLIIQQYPSMHFENFSRKLPILKEKETYLFTLVCEKQQVAVKLGILFHTVTGDQYVEQTGEQLSVVAPEQTKDYEVQLFIKTLEDDNWLKLYELVIQSAE